MEYLGSPRTIKEWLEYKDDYPGEGQLYVKASEATISMGSLCWPQSFDPDEFSDDDFDTFEARINDGDYRPFLSQEQIEDVIENLKQQQPRYNENRLLQALVCYWGTDAFIRL